MLDLKKTVNSMVAQLSMLVNEVTRVPGQFGGWDGGDLGWAGICFQSVRHVEGS
jgi:hypothetical protein